VTLVAATAAVAMNAGTAAARPSPTLGAARLADAGKIDSGYSHTCVVRSGGRVACWGDNAFGQLGDGTKDDKRTPVFVRGISDAVAVAAGGDHTCAIRAGGSVVCWGKNSFAELGTGSRTGPEACSLGIACSTRAASVVGLTNAVAIAAAPQHTCAVLGDGTARCWGRNSAGELGTGSYDGPDNCSDDPDYPTACSLRPAAVTGITNAAAIAAGDRHTCALSSAGAVTCWGWQHDIHDEYGYYVGQVSSPTPVIVSGLGTATAIALGDNHGSGVKCAVLSNGRVACWGNGTYGALGNGSGASSIGPLLVGGIDDATSVAVGYAGACALRASGSVACWGDGHTGQLGNPSAPAWSGVPVPVITVGDAQQLGAGGGHGWAQACAWSAEDRIYCWGDNYNGQLGDGSSATRSSSPVLVAPVAGPPPVTPKRMLAFGDSYTSGEGLVPEGDLSYDCATDLHQDRYFADTTVPVSRLGNLQTSFWMSRDCDTRTLSNVEPVGWMARPQRAYENFCHRHARAYPNQIRTAFGIAASDYQFVACSGAVTNNVGLVDQPKAQHASPGSPLNVAGGLTQIDTIAPQFLTDRPDLVTIGIGGNDAGFGGLINRCLADCLADQEFVDATMANIRGHVFKQLRTTFVKLAEKFSPATVIAFGYPSIIGDPELPCASTGFGPWKVNKPELLWLRDDVIPAINASVAKAAAEAGVVYADITEATRGHELCSDAEVRWINGVRLGDDHELHEGTPKVIGRESFHPNQWGHDAIADSFVEHFTDGAGHLTVTDNPPPAPQTPDPGSPSLYLGSVNAGAVAPCGTDCLQPAACVQGCRLHVDAQGFAPTSNLSVSLRSDPVQRATARLTAELHASSVLLGTLHTDIHGDATGDFQLPADVPAGNYGIVVESDTGVIQYGSDFIKVVDAPAGDDDDPGDTDDPGSPTTGFSSTETSEPPGSPVGAALSPSPAPERSPSLKATLSVRWQVGRATTRLVSGQVRGAVAGMQVRITCRAPRQRRSGCRYRSRVRTITRSAKRVSLGTATRMTLRPGTILTVTLTRPGWTGTRYEFRIRDHRRPSRHVSVTT
jgi:alpha-tubulin suppressor-like RCC1 family protein